MKLSVLKSPASSLLRSPIISTKSRSPFYNTKRLYVSKTNTKKNESMMYLDPSGILGSSSAAAAAAAAAATDSVTVVATTVNTSAVAIPNTTSTLQEPSWDRIYDIEAPASMTYLRTLPKNQLFSLSMIGMVTMNKFFLDTCIKLFPYVPIPMMKIFISDLYCGGETMDEVLQCGRQLQKRGISNMMLSLTIEDAEGTKNIDINHIVKETIASIHKILLPNFLSQLDATASNINDIAPGYIALKPSALVKNPSDVLLNFNQINDPHWNKQRQILIDNCSKITEEICQLNKTLLEKYPNRQSPFFVSTIDAEKYDLQKNGVYELQRILFKKFNSMENKFASCIGTWQLYLKDSLKDIINEQELAQKGNYKLGLKLVRGAYIHTEPERDLIIHNTKLDTDNHYNKVATFVTNDMLQNGKNSTFGHLVIASHNYHSQLIATNLINNSKSSNKNYVQNNVIFGQLLGMADNVTHDLINTYGVKNIIKYVPWGPAIETKDYLLRRLQENGDAVRADNGWPLLKSIFLSLRSSGKD
ncbi:similar to Saccharomyces cerevisiae YLR142W PUT1 Proline oxidase, nuclear-encoded mitochondrial protein involved in utilization of proline as sole nitrogen source [Maudiozyma saulgeensis]|uniref:Proline dehydrogenase n=1 Tax=Maudiozyma saulgeensis TaxID=1789683 RepID=A0A1X7R4T5_9SACH|nr:similar to Saccharomyces cerevisiae YLR142W PUT1 Proline oxidase, nuclear-encoded mitochondrial protein involved in utilization of proline as sole nitrogen source [Kazachstania saulgeensis]